MKMNSFHLEQGGEQFDTGVFIEQSENNFCLKLLMIKE